MSRYCTIDTIPENVHTCLVLGARLREERYLTPILELRMQIVREIHRKRPDIKFYLSGCCADTTAMYKHLVENFGLPEELFFIHHDGINTYHSVYDMVHRYREHPFLVLTSTFHIKRTMAIARWLRADAIALDISGYEKSKENPYATRERLATVKAAYFAAYDRLGIHHLVCKVVFAWRKIKRFFWLHFHINRNSGKDRAFVEEILTRARTEMGSENPVIYFAKQMEGLPDVMDILTYITPERLIVKPRELDCTSFVEYALAYAYTYAEGKTDYGTFCDYVRKIRYRDGVIEDYTSRNHYFTWLADNLAGLGLAREVDGRDIPGSDDPYAEPFSAKQTLRLGYMTDHHYFYPPLEQHPEYLERICGMERESNGREFPFVPRESLCLPKESGLGAIRDGDILMIVVDSHTWARGLDIKHLLIAKWRDDRLHFIHCDQSEEVVKESTADLFSYLSGKLTMIGIRVLRPIFNIKEDDKI